MRCSDVKVTAAQPRDIGCCRSNLGGEQIHGFECRGLFIKTILSASVDSFYLQGDSGYSLCKGGLYHHAVGTAIISEKIASITGKASPATAYAAGLLHDIGTVVLDQYMACTLFYRELQHEKIIYWKQKKIIWF